jgi:hypothetical protein
MRSPLSWDQDFHKGKIQSTWLWLLEDKMAYHPILQIIFNTAMKNKNTSQLA